MLRKDIAVDAIEIESVSASRAARDLPGLATRLHVCVEAGAGVNFVRPYPLAEPEISLDTFGSDRLDQTTIMYKRL